MIAWALERRRADEAYLARFQNLDVLYLVPFHFRRRAATERYLSERNFSELIGDSPFRFCSSILGDHPRLFSSEPSLGRGRREGCSRFDSLALRTSVHFEDAIWILAEILLELNSPRGN